MKKSEKYLITSVFLYLIWATMSLLALNGILKFEGMLAVLFYVIAGAGGMCLGRGVGLKQLGK
jgi:hypothetical protein